MRIGLHLPRLTYCGGPATLGPDLAGPRLLGERVIPEIASW